MNDNMDVYVADKNDDTDVDDVGGYNDDVD